MASSASKNIIICLQNGGADPWWQLIPLDATNTTKYLAVHASWDTLNASLQSPAGSSRDPSDGDYVALAPTNSGDHGGRSWGLTNDMSGWSARFNEADSETLLVFNVGILDRSISDQEIADDEAGNPSLFAVPDSSRAHNGAKNLIASGEISRGGEGRIGQLMEVLGGSSQVQIVNIGHTEDTGRSNAVPELALSRNLTVLSPFDNLAIAGSNATERLTYYTAARPDVDLQSEAAVEIRDSTLNIIVEFDDIIDNPITDSTGAVYDGGGTDAVNGSLAGSYPDTFLGRAGRFVAEMLGKVPAGDTQARSFLLQRGGFDTHGTQARDLPALLQDVDATFTALALDVRAMGISDNTMRCIFSDFARSLFPNGTGKDHSWATFIIVEGGGVSGGRFINQMPDPDTDHPRIHGRRGDIVPELAWEQVWAEIFEWAGASPAQIATILPELAEQSWTPPDFFS